MLDKLKNKYVFFDIDGTLSEYKEEDKSYDGKCLELECQSFKNLLFSDLFYRARPSKYIQNIIINLELYKVLV